ncbi:hypothetical protein Scep_019210 [Stephania cephalantha]|uniref:Aminotransferase-like plant mobile domain-containing protein n=1 Tax=Stephania cephalantha TaxID=152367 RepID=A0AAP0IBE0_9MAGN
MFISAFIERWKSETNTFHFPFGEMSITLEDVSKLLHMPVMGKVVECDAPSTAEEIELVSRAIGVPEVEAEKQLNKDLKVNKSWLKRRWGVRPKPSKKVNTKTQLFPLVECTARAYL